MCQEVMPIKNGPWVQKVPPLFPTTLKTHIWNPNEMGVVVRMALHLKISTFEQVKKP